MELVLDSNIVISALISSNGITRRLLFSDKLVLFAPDLLFDEVFRYKKIILKKSGLSEDEFNIVFGIICSRITFVSYQSFKKFINESENCCPDINDSEFFALAFSKRISLWSNDKALKKQDKLKVFFTNELIDNLKKNY